MKTLRGSLYPLILRPPKWLRVFALVVATSFTLVFVYVFFTAGPSAWPTLAAGLAVLVALLGALEAGSCRLELREDSLLLVSNFKRREYQRAEFSEVNGARGEPVALKTSSGQWVSLPGTLPGGASVIAILRNWLRRQ